MANLHPDHATFMHRTGYLSFDLDSTLCDTRHRKGIIEKFTSRGLPIDWTEYAKACADDEPLGLVTLVRSIQAHGMRWVAVSGRSEAAREATEDWLSAHKLTPDAIFLERDTARHSEIGHTAYKTELVIEADRLLRDAADSWISTHFDDWSQVAKSITEASDGRIATVTVTPPGMRAVAAETLVPDNPGEASEANTAL